MLAVSFHAELGEDERLHRLFLEMVDAARLGGQPDGSRGDGRAGLATRGEFR